jgi:hypothetical protein
LKYYLGCDPDLKKTSVAIIDEAGLPVQIGVIPSASKATGREAILSTVASLQEFSADYEVTAAAIEAQEIYRGVTKNPRSIMLLGTVAGACLRHFAELADTLYFPPPQEWKGTVPKQIHQARIYKRIGWAHTRHGKDPKSGYCAPDTIPAEIEASTIKKTDWKHIGDALGLALWAKDKEEKLK